MIFGTITLSNDDSMRESRKFCQRGFKFDNVFFFNFHFFYLVDEGI